MKFDFQEGCKMIVMTISNWRKKLRLLLLVVVVVLIAGGIFINLDIGDVLKGASNDRDSNGSLKVEAAPGGEIEEVDSDWWGEFVETLKTYYQE
jgi:hypothetical protein